jgi:hypothetical protein
MNEQNLGCIGHDATPLSRCRYVLAEGAATVAFGR